jgi:hypothetical protein
MIKVRYAVFTVAVGGAIVGCLATASVEQLTKRAAFDFNCPGSNLRYNVIDDKTRGVVGCSKRGTYVETCDGPKGRTDTRCTWVLNGAIQTLEQPPQPQPGSPPPSPPSPPSPPAGAP